MIVKPFVRKDPDQPEREVLRYMDPESEDQHEAKYYNEGCSSCGHQRRIFCWGGLKEEDAVICYECWDPDADVGYPQFDASFPSHERAIGEVVDWYNYGHCHDCWAEVKDSLGINPLPPRTLGEKVRAIQEKLTEMDRTQLDKADAYLISVMKKWASMRKKSGNKKKRVGYNYKVFSSGNGNKIHNHVLKAPIERTKLKKLQEKILDTAGVTSLPDPRRHYAKFDPIVATRR